MNVQHARVDTETLAQARRLRRLHRIQRCWIDRESPWHRRLFTPQLAVDEVADATGEDADARQRRQKVEHVRKATPALASEDKHGQDHTDQAAMERHAPLPDTNDAERV